MYSQSEWKWYSYPDNVPSAYLESDWGSYARVMAKLANGEVRKSVYDDGSEQFQIVSDANDHGDSLDNVVEWCYVENH
jgi:hypothetical protein